jgi:type VI secretion system protein ImpM
MDDPGPRIGFFGKIPSHGDFVRHAFPSELSKRWDSWLQAGLRHSRETLGDDWLDAYLSSPIWRFCLSAGLCGKSQWLGAMMPSVDRVGRCFPLTVVRELPADSSLFGTAASTGSWFGALEETILTTLEADSMTAEELEAQLTALPPLVERESQGTGTEPQLTDGDSFAAVRLPDSGHVEDAPGLMADALARRSCGDFSLWWSGGSAKVSPGARIYADLPPADLFWTLLRE